MSSKQTTYAFHDLRIACVVADGAFHPLAALLAAYAERSGALGLPDLTIRVIAPGSPGALALSGEPAGARPLFSHGRVRARELPGSASSALLLENVGSSTRLRLDVDPDGVVRRAEGVAAAGSPFEATEAAVLFQIGLLLALRSRRVFHLHAAGLVDPAGRPVLVAGASGAGKTTTTLSLLEAGYGYLGDDSVFLRRAPGSASVEVLGFRRPFHVAEATLSAFPRLAPLLGDRFGSTGKRELDPSRAFPGRAYDACGTPALLLLPSVTSLLASRLGAVPQAEVLARLIEGSAALAIDALPHRDESLAVLVDLAQKVEARELLLGADALARPAEALAPLVAEALASAAGPRGVGRPRAGR